jgi:hypothetical protein
MAYDSARGVTVLFGGYAYGFFFDDTFEWDGNSWHERDKGPAERADEAMAYDAKRGVTVMYGGDTNYSYYQDTYEWDGGAWIRRRAGTTKRRSHHTMAYDSARGVTVLFGGGVFSEGTKGDTWEWNGNGDGVARNYGAGWPGTSGVPDLTSSGKPDLCGNITISIDNSRAATTPAVLIVGSERASVPTVYGGTLLIRPIVLVPFVLPAAGISVPYDVPCGDAYCGFTVDLQVLESDPGASRGVSFTPGLELFHGH